MKRVAIITGGGSGIGAACVKQFHDDGYEVVVADRNEVAAHEIAEQFGGSARHLDVTDEQSVRSAFDHVIRTYGRLDVAVNSAGLGMPGRLTVDELDFMTWRKILSVNLDGLFLCISAEASAMLKNGGGSIVNIASVMSVVGTPGASPYVASKHGLIGLTKAAALDFADRGIRVNAVGPGHVETPMFLKWSDAEQARIISQYPVGRIAKPEEVASFVSVIADEKTSFATGAYYPLDGGYTAV